MSKKRQLFLLMAPIAGLIFLSGCDKIQSMFQTSLVPTKTAAPVVKPSASTEETNPSQGTVLAKVNNDVITLESFDEKVKTLQALSPEIKLNTLDAKKAYLNDLITQTLLVQEAKARGIEKKKEVRDAIDAVVARQLILDEIKGITIDPVKIETFYNQYKKEFATPEEIRAKEIVVSSEPAAKEILIGLLQGGDFAAVAKEKSTAPSAAQGGDVGFVKKTDKFDKYREVISTLEVGQVSQIFKGPDNNFYIVKVEERKGGTVPALTEVYDQIKNGLLQQEQAQRIQELTDKLKKEAKIDIKEDLLR
jgi:parvulin-like peptidyl-prolyl isomerase